MIYRPYLYNIKSMSEIYNHFHKNDNSLNKISIYNNNYLLRSYSSSSYNSKCNALAEIRKYDDYKFNFLEYHGYRLCITAYKNRDYSLTDLDKRGLCEKNQY